VHFNNVFLELLATDCISVKDLKTKKTTESYAARFSQRMKADEEKAIAALEEQKHRMCSY
jgi:hypothetical protein